MVVYILPEIFINEINLNIAQFEEKHSQSYIHVNNS